MMHALLIDYGYRELPRVGRARREYEHLRTGGVAVVERVGNPRLPVSVTLYAGPWKPLVTADQPAHLHMYLRRGYA